jgi:hypothetical protein
MVSLSQFFLCRSISFPLLFCEGVIGMCISPFESGVRFLGFSGFGLHPLLLCLLLRFLEHWNVRVSSGILWSIRSVLGFTLSLEFFW